MSWPELRVVLTAMALGLAMLISAWVGRRRSVGAVLLALLSFVWLTVDAQWEGPHLWRITSHNSLVLADLAALLGFAVAGFELWRLRRQSCERSAR